MPGAKERSFKVLSLDGGGSKGVYTIGVLGQLEAHLGKGPLCESFDLIYGTSTGAIVAALIGLGWQVNAIKDLYFKLVPDVMARSDAEARSKALEGYARDVFGDKHFDSFRRRLAIVATNYVFSRPTIFKSHVDQTYSMQKTFEAGFGATIVDALMSSAAAVPYFNKRTIFASHGTMTLIDGGFVANNPSIFALTDATRLGFMRDQIKLLSIGTGLYAQAQVPMNFLQKIQLSFLKKGFPLEILDTTLSASSNSTEILTRLLFPDIQYLRVNEPLVEQGFSTHLLEADPAKLGTMWTHGIQSFGAKQNQVAALFDG